MFGNDRKIKISIGNSRKSTNWPLQELYWSEFVEKVSKPVRTEETFATYMSFPKVKQDELKDVGGFVGGELINGKRRNGSASSRHLITLDADNIPPGGTQAVLNAVDQLGCAYVIYSTRKHESAAPRLRIVFPLDVPSSPDEYEPIARKLASFLNMEIFDPTTFEAVRLMYWPSASLDSEFVFLYGDKPFLSKNGMLGMYQNWRDISEWPEVPGAVKLRNRSLKKQGDPVEKIGVVGAFCKTYDIESAIAEFLSDVYVPCDHAPGRYTYLDGSTVGGAVLYEDGKFLYSHHATDPAGGRLSNAFDLVRLHRYHEDDENALPDTPITGLPSYKLMCEFATKQESVIMVLHTERYEKAKEAFSGAIPMGADEIDPNWRVKLRSHPKTGATEATVNNFKLILENDPLLRGMFYHDEFANRPVVTRQLPWEEKVPVRKFRLWSDGDDAGLRSYIEEVYRVYQEKKIHDAMAIYAMNHKQHKIKDYLTSLQWDGVKRLDTLLIDYFGAEDSAYSRETIRKTLTAAVTRVMHPGTKFDTMIILSGAQGVGKSTFFGMLGKDWYSDSLATFEGRDAAEIIQGYWIIEAGELTGFNKSEMNAVKQFLSKREDVYRAPYGRRPEAFPRSCIIVGTTNDTEFLKDRTGNRRFWPVDLGKQEPVKSVFKDLPGEVDQIWAEAFVRYQAGEKLYVDGAVEEEAIKQQEEHKESNPKEGIIKEFIGRQVPVDWNKRDLAARRDFWNFQHKEVDQSMLVERDRICAAEVWCECFYGDLKLMRRSDSVEINSILATLEGWEKLNGALKFGTYYGAQKGYIKR